MAKYRVTPRAEEDLKNISRYTQEHWGKTQRNTYLKNLENRFKSVTFICIHCLIVPILAFNLAVPENWPQLSRVEIGCVCEYPSADLTA